MVFFLSSSCFFSSSVLSLSSFLLCSLFSLFHSSYSFIKSLILFSTSLNLAVFRKQSCILVLLIAPVKRFLSTLAPKIIPLTPMTARVKMALSKPCCLLAKSANFSTPLSIILYALSPSWFSFSAPFGGLPVAGSFHL